MNKYDRIFEQASKQLNEAEDQSAASIAVYQTGMGAMQAVVNLINAGNKAVLTRIISMGEQKAAPEVPDQEAGSGGIGAQNPAEPVGQPNTNSPTQQVAQ